MIDKIRQKVQRYIDEYSLLEKGNTVIIGVSGGADSIMLLDVLNSLKEEYQLSLEVAHVHHGARAASDEEEAYVRRICKELDIPCHVHYCQIQALATEYKTSEEAAGRLERYNFFISLTNEYAKIATAHTMNDQAETMIMRFVRGADVKGLSGIPKRRDNIIRPLLCLTRTEIELYCELRGLHYYHDESNFTTKYTRNRIRLECLPYIQEKLNSNIITTLVSHGELYQQEEEFLNDYVDKLYKRCVESKQNKLSINIEVLEEEKIYIKKKLILRCIEVLLNSAKDISLVHINQCVELVNKQSGRQMRLPNEIIVRRSYNQMIIEKYEEGIFTNYETRLKLGINNIEAFGIQIECKLVNGKRFEQTKENMYTKYIDYDKIKDNLCIRTRQPGDTIVLEHGSRKLKKLLIDAKVPSDIRDTLPILVNGEDLVWVVGVRLSSQYFVTKDTKNILEIKILNKEAQEGLC